MAAGGRSGKARGRGSAVTVTRAPDALLDDVRRAWRSDEEGFLAAMIAPDGAGGLEPRRVAVKFAEAVARVREELFARLNAALADIARERAKLEPAEAGEAEARARFGLGTARAEHEDDLLAAERDLAAAARDYRLFRARHRLAREPQLPVDQLVSAAWLALVLALEALFNAPFFYVEGQSLVGSAFEGALVAAANVGLGFVAGAAGLRFLLHRELAPWRLFGVAAAALAVTTAAGLHALMGARRLAAADAGGEGSDAAAALLASLNPVVLTVAFSAFAAMGFLFSAYKGWQGFFEPYPGYGLVAKRLNAARARVEDVRHDYQQAALKALDEVKRDLDEELDADRDAAAAIRAAAARAEEAALAAADAVAELKARARWLLRQYREAYGVVRGERPPAELGDDFDLEAALPSADGVAKALSEAEARLSANEAAYAEGLRGLEGLMAAIDQTMAQDFEGLRRRAVAREAEEAGDATGAQPG